MCDYSLQHVRSRAAQVGDKLTTRNFGTGTRGFAAPGDPKTAVFRQINRDLLRAHHDALEFPDGTVVLLTDLCDGQSAVVLQLPARPLSKTEVEAQKRVEYIG